MKSKRRKRVIASVLCMVLMLSTGMSTLAEADAGTVPAVEEKAAAQTTAQETESTSTDAQTAETGTQTQTETEAQTETKQTEEAAQTKQEETTAAQPTEEASGGETTQTETEPTTPENATTVQNQENNQNTAQDTQTTTPQQDVSESEENLTEKDSTDASGSSEKAGEIVLNTAMQLKQEWKDADGTVKERVTANIPEGAFQAANADITMTVKKVTGDRSTEIQELMKDRLPENSYLGEFFLYDIQFEVAGEKVEPQKAITFTFEGNDITADDSERVNVFYMDPSDSSKLVEITQKSEMLETLKNQGKSTANIDDYDLSEVSIKDGKIESATAEGKLATVYGCYVEAFSKEVVLTKTVDGTTVKLTAPEGAFPMDSEKVQMEVKALTEEQESEIQKELSDQAEKDGKELQQFVGMDITLKADGEEIQPQIPVQVSFEKEDMKLQDKETVEGFQLDEDKNEVSFITGSANEDGTATVEAEHFTPTGFAVYANITEETENTRELNFSFEGKPVSNGENDWQIVQNGKGYETEAEVDSQTNAVRVQKNVVPTDTENVFQIYLNVEPQMTWEALWRATEIIVCTSNDSGDKVTEEGFKSLWGNLTPNPDDVYTKNSGEGEGKKNPHKVHVYIHDGSINDTTNIIDEYEETMYTGIGKCNNGSIYYQYPFEKEYYYKLTNISFKNGDEIELHISTSNGEIRYNLLTSFENASITDNMGGDILYRRNATYDGGSIEEPDYNTSGTLIWKLPNLEDLPEIDWDGEESDDYELVEEEDGTVTVYRKHAMQMMYEVALDVTNYNGGDTKFRSAALDEPLYKGSSTEYPNNTNGTTTLKYDYSKIENGDIVKHENNQFQITSPKVRGLLYDVEFQKVDEKGEPLEGATFTLSGKYTVTGEIVTKTAISGKDGWVKFHDLPWGTYTLTEAEAPQGYDPWTGTQEIILCYTTNSSDLVKDHSSEHQCDLTTDQYNMLYNTSGIGSNGKIMNQARKGLAWNLIKTSYNDPNLRLEGAIFTLSSKEDPSNIYTGESEENGIVQWEDINGAVVNEVDILPGEYVLKEIQAPTGYQNSSITWTVKIKKGEQPEIVENIESDGKKLDVEDSNNDGIYEIVISNKVVYSLPSAGGPGIFWYTISGALLLMAGTLILYNLKKGEVLKK